MVKKTRRIIPHRYNPLYWRMLAFHDAHGLKNRTWLFEKAEKLYKQKRELWDFALIYIDLRNFRQVNNEFSHIAGNKVLTDFYSLLESKFRLKKDVNGTKIKRTNKNMDILIAREGGDEFVVFLPLGICDERARQSAHDAIMARAEGLSIKYRGVTVSARQATVFSIPGKNYKNFDVFFRAADKELTNIRRTEKN